MKFKKYLCKLLLLIILFLFAKTGISQKNPEKTLEEMVEEIVSNQGEDMDYTEIIEDLTYYSAQPLELNTANVEELEKLHLLNDIQIRNLINYRIKYYGIRTVYELANIDGFSKEIIEKIRPFVQVQTDIYSQAPSFKNFFKYGNNSLYLRTSRTLESQKGYSAISDSQLLASPNSRYLGSPYKIYTRYEHKYRNFFSFGFVAEKDAGEEFFKGSQNRGFDYYSAHLILQNYKKIKSLVIGDFKAQFGQGLVMWSGMALNKSSMTMNLRRSAQGIKKYSSTDENLFMRGAAVTYKLGKFDVSTFVSSHKIDANLNYATDTIDDEVIEISSLQNTGLHSTPSELEDKDAATEKVAGGNITYFGDQLKIGSTITHYQLSNYLGEANDVYRKFSLPEKKNTFAGIDYVYAYKHIAFWGEIATNQHFSSAWVQGFSTPLCPEVSIAGVYRNYSTKYSNIYANGFGDNTSPNNEKGFYLGTEMQFTKRLGLAAYTDLYKSDWLSFRTNSPSSGADYLVQMNYSFSRRLKVYFKLKRESTIINSTEETTMKYTVENTKSNYRFHLSFAPLEQVELDSRIEYCTLDRNNQHESGILIYQDFNYNFKTIPVSFSVRLAVNNTSSYDTRIYAYENDVLYSFSIPAYYYQRTRSYLLIKYSPTENLDFWFRISRNQGYDTDIMGSGLNEINGSKQTEIKLQLKLSF